MIHVILLIICVLSIETFIRLNFLSFLRSILKLTKKVTYIIPNKKISDHWKELVIPVYAFKIMKFSLQILLILLCIISFFIAADILFSGFISFTLSFIGIIESLALAFVYLYLRKLVT